MASTIERMVPAPETIELPELAEEIDLDPDWEQARTLAHNALDQVINFLSSVRERPTWQPPPADMIARFSPEEAPPLAGSALEDVLAQVERDVLPYPTGNISPRFWGWVMGNGTLGGVLGELIAAAMNSNAPGVHQSATYVEEQLLSWLAQIMGLPAGASGITVGGAAEANLLGLTAARDEALRRRGAEPRGKGLQGMTTELVGYGTAETHVVLARAFRLLGLGDAALRKVAVDDQYRMDVAALESAILADKEAGRAPFVVCASAGTVQCGAIDPLPEIAAICKRHGLWLHVDGAFGAVAMFSERLKPALAGLEQCDSLAFDGHKWLHMPYGTAFALLRDPQQLHRSFSTTSDAAYTQASGRGIMTRPPLYTDRGIDFSRRFNALAAWMLIREAGVTRLGQLVEQNVSQARYLAALVERSEHLELVAPVPLNVVCLRYVAPGLSEEALNDLNRELLTRLQEEGLVMPSGTTVRGRYATRIAITNHRSRREDFDLLVAEVERIGGELVAG